jgi:hypothetical protein
MAAIPLTEFLSMASSDGEISANSASEMVAYISMLQLDSKTVESIREGGHSCFSTRSQQSSIWSSI